MCDEDEEENRAAGSDEDLDDEVNFRVSLADVWLRVSGWWVGVNVLRFLF